MVKTKPPKKYCFIEQFFKRLMIQIAQSEKRRKARRKDFETSKNKIHS